MMPRPRSTPAPPPVAGARWIALTRGRFTLVDEADFPTLVQIPWCADSGGYATSRNGRLHAFLLRAKGIDHINGDRLDNRRQNLRPARPSENCSNRPKPSNNTSGFKGVSFDRRTGRWVATIGLNRRQVWLGRHDTAEQAARAYDAAALQLHGAFARPNEPPKGLRGSR